MSQRPLAKCNKVPNGHVLARAGVLNGEPVIEYSAAVGILRERSPKGRDIEGRWLMAELPSRSPDAVTITHGYCSACNKDFDLPMNEIADVFRANRNPIVIKPVQK